MGPRPAACPAGSPASRMHAPLAGDATAPACWRLVCDRCSPGHAPQPTSQPCPDATTGRSPQAPPRPAGASCTTAASPPHNCCLDPAPPLRATAGAPASCWRLLYDHCIPGYTSRNGLPRPVAYNEARVRRSLRPPARPAARRAAKPPRPPPRARAARRLPPRSPHTRHRRRRCWPPPTSPPTRTAPSAARPPCQGSTAACACPTPRPPRAQSASRWEGGRSGRQPALGAAAGAALAAAAGALAAVQRGAGRVPAARRAALQPSACPSATLRSSRAPQMTACPPVSSPTLHATCPNHPPLSTRVCSWTPRTTACTPPATGPRTGASATSRLARCAGCSAVAVRGWCARGGGARLGTGGRL